MTLASRALSLRYHPPGRKGSRRKGYGRNFYFFFSLFHYCLFFFFFFSFCLLPACINQASQPWVASGQTGGVCKGVDGHLGKGKGYGIIPACEKTQLNKASILYTHRYTHRPINMSPSTRSAVQCGCSELAPAPNTCLPTLTLVACLQHECPKTNSREPQLLYHTHPNPNPHELQAEPSQAAEQTVQPTTKQPPQHRRTSIHPPIHLTSPTDPIPPSVFRTHVRNPEPVTNKRTPQIPGSVLDHRRQTIPSTRITHPPLSVFV